jgi:hypothetical protein
MSVGGEHRPGLGLHGTHRRSGALGTVVIVQKPMDLDDLVAEVSAAIPNICGRNRGLSIPSLPARASKAARAATSNPLQSRSHSPSRGTDTLEVDEVRQLVGGSFGYSGDHHPGHAVPHQHDVAELLECQHPQHVADMGIQAGLRGGEVGALAQSRQRRRVHVVAGRPQVRGDPPSAPAPMKALVNEQEHRHPAPSSQPPASYR